MKEKNKIAAIILIAGSSTRYGKEYNKNFEKINEKPIFIHSLEKLLKNSYIDEFVLVCKKDEIEIAKKFINYKDKRNIYIVEGGNTRKESVYQGIKKTNSDIVLIHDGARPLFEEESVYTLLDMMKEYKGATIAVKSKDTIKIGNESNEVIQTTERKNTWCIQTPQCFHRNILLEAHETCEGSDITDDCMLLERIGEKVKLVEGNYKNIKLTTYEDIEILKVFMK